MGNPAKCGERRPRSGELTVPVPFGPTFAFSSGMESETPNTDEEWTALVDVVDENSIATIEGTFQQIGVDPQAYRCECRAAAPESSRPYWRLSTRRSLKQQLREALAKICDAR